jgi:hypothetical protein
MTPLTSGITARRMYGLVEPIGLIPYAADEPAEALLALGLRNYWDTYFAGRPAPLGRDVPAGVRAELFGQDEDGAAVGCGGELESDRVGAPGEAGPVVAEHPP